MIAHLPGGPVVLRSGGRRRLQPATACTSVAAPPPQPAVAAQPVGAPRRRTFRQLGLNVPPSPRELTRQLEIAVAHAETSATDTAIALASAIGSQNARSFRFAAPNGMSARAWHSTLAGSIFADSALVIGSAGDAGYWAALRAALAGDIGAEAAEALGQDWLENHYRWIVWKLACQLRCFAATLGPLGFGPKAVVRQLVGRYEREMVKKKFSVLQRIVDATDVPGVQMVLCIAAVRLGDGLVELTDGWHSAWAQCDAPLLRQLRRGRLPIGMKLRIFGAELVPSGEKRMSDATAHRGAEFALPSLLLHANGVRRAAWDTRLGKTKRRVFRVALSSLIEGGGPAPSVHVRIERRYGPRALEKSTDDGESVAAWYTEAGYAAKLSREAAGSEDAPAREQGVETDDGPPRARTSWLLRLVVSDLSGAVGGCDRQCAASIWLNSADQAVHFQEGAAYCVVAPSVKRASFNDFGELELEAKVHAWQPIRTTEPVSAGSLDRRRACLPLHLVEMRPSGTEFDCAGVLLAAGLPTPGEHGRLLRQLFVGDASGTILGVRWLLGPTEPTPRLKVGEPVSLRNLVSEHHTRFQAPHGAEHLARNGALHMCLCSADTLGARCAVVLPHSAERSAHLRPTLDALVKSLDNPATQRRYAESAALAAAAHEAKLSPAPDGTPAVADTPGAAAPSCVLDDELWASVEARLHSGGATFSQLCASASSSVPADATALRRVLDAMRGDMLCYIVPSTGEFRLM